MARTPNGASSIYLGKDGYWHRRVTVGVKDDGRLDRRHVMGTQADVTRKVRALERQRDGGTVRKAGRSWTVEKWLLHWVENIAAPFVRDNTLAGYRVAVNVHLVPGLGKHRLDRLEPEHLEKLYVRMMRSGSAPATAHQAHRTLRTALNEAVRRGHILRNPATLAKAPRLVEKEVEPYTVDEVRLLLKAAMGGRNGTRWAIALALGLRQGEALGLKWADVDLDVGTLIVRRGRLRPRWRHGCDGTCGREYGGHCPQRVAERAETAETKSRAGRRVVGLPSELVELLKAHRAEQDQERVIAGQLGPTKVGCSPRRPVARSTRVPTGPIGRSSSSPPECGTAGYTTPGIRPRRCSCCSASRSGLSWASWVGRTPRWPRGTSTSPRRSSGTSPPASAASSGHPGEGNWMS